MRDIHIALFNILYNKPTPDNTSVFKGNLQFEVPTVCDVPFEIPIVTYSTTVRDKLYEAVKNPNNNTAIITLPVYVRKNYYIRAASGSVTFLKNLFERDYYRCTLKDKNYIIGCGNIFTEDGIPYLIPFYKIKFTDDLVPIATGMILKLSYKILSGTDMLDKYIRGKFCNSIISLKDSFIPMYTRYRSSVILRSTKKVTDIYGYPTSDIQIVYEDLSKYITHPAYPTPKDNDKVIHKMIVSKIDEIYQLKK